MPFAGFSDRGFSFSQFICGGGIPFYGAGLSGYLRRDTVIDAVTLLTEDLVAHSVTINAPVRVQTNRIIARDTITINSGGLVFANGTAGYASTVGGGYTGPINALHEGFAGGDGAEVAGEASLGGGSAISGLASGWVSPAMPGAGEGGDGDGGSVGALGGYSSLDPRYGGPNVFQPSIWQDSRVVGASIADPFALTLDVRKCGGGAGGGGGGSSTTEPGYGGGSGGGVIWMAADKIIINAPGVRIQSDGGSGQSRTSTAGNGGGGQGGVVILVCGELIFKDSAGTISVAGGTGGVGNGNSRDGTNGTDGRVLIFSAQAVQDFTQSTVTATQWNTVKSNYRTP